MKKVEKYLLWAINGGIFLLLFMPFVVVNSLYFPFVAGKGFYFRIIVEIIAVLYVVLALINPVWRPRKNVLYYIFGSLLVFLFISNVLSPNSYKSFFSNFERVEGYINIVHLALFFMVAHSVVVGKSLWNKILATSLFVSLLVWGHVLLQLGGVLDINQGGVRVDGPFGNAAYLAMYALIHIFIALYFTLQSKIDVVKRIVFSVVALANVFVLYHTQTRGAILGLLGGLFVTAAIIAWLKREEKKVRKIAIGTLIALIAFVGLFIAFKDTSFVRENPTLKRFASISLTETTTLSRFKIWGMALEGVKEKPVFGWGQESFNYVFNTYYDPVLYKQEQWFDRSHNIVMDWLVAGGILGGGAYLSLFVFAVYLLWKREDFSVYEKAALIGLISAYFFQNLFVFDNPTSYMLFVLLLAFVAARHNEDGEQESRDAIDIEPNMKIFGGIVLIAMVVMSSYVFSIKPLRANSLLISAIQSYNNFNTFANAARDFRSNPQNARMTRMEISGMIQNPEVPTEMKSLLRPLTAGDQNDSLVAVFEQKALELADQMEGNFKKVFDLDTFATHEAQEQIAFLLQQVSNNQVFPIDKKAAFRLFAREQLLDHAESAPLDSRNQLLVGTTFRQLGDIDLAIEYIQEASNLSPQKQTTLLELGTAFLQKGDSVNALDAWRRAYELDTSFLAAKLSYAGGLIFDGQSEEGERILKEVKEINEREVYESTALLHIYTLIEDYESIRDIWLWRINKNPGNINARIALAATYYELDQKQKAISVLEEAIEIDSNFTQLGNQYISDIRAGRKPQ